MRGTSRRKGNGAFWHRPGIMHMVADVLILAATAAFGYAAVIALLRLPFFPLREVVVVTPLRQVSSAQLEYAARSAVVGNFFTVSLESVRQGFEKVPWVRRAQLRRRWPNGIELAVEEHEAAAVWKRGDGAMRLVDAQGEVFAASADAQLPNLAGPEGSSAEVLKRYQEFSEALAPVARKPRSVVLTSRLAWQVGLDDGVVIELGRDQPKSPVVERLKRFVSVYGEALARLPAGAAVVDLRYPNGFAVRPGRGRQEPKSN